MKTKEQQLLRRIRFLLMLFMLGLVLSGITALPLVAELQWIDRFSEFYPLFIRSWIHEVSIGLDQTQQHYPYLFYGTDWLAFAHIIIAIAFIGPLRDPLKNIWVVEFGIIACLLIFPLAGICGYIRHIPIYWRLIDCSFGALGLIPLCYALRYIKSLELFLSNNNKIIT